MMESLALPDSIVLTRWVVGNASLVQNVQSAVERLRHGAGVLAHRMSLEAPKTNRPSQPRRY